MNKNEFAECCNIKCPILRQKCIDYKNDATEYENEKIEYVVNQTKKFLSKKKTIIESKCNELIKNQSPHFLHVKFSIWRPDFVEDTGDIHTLFNIVTKSSSNFNEHPFAKKNGIRYMYGDKYSVDQLFVPCKSINEI